MCEQCEQLRDEILTGCESMDGLQIIQIIQGLSINLAVRTKLEPMPWEVLHMIADQVERCLNSEEGALELLRDQIAVFEEHHL